VRVRTSDPELTPIATWLTQHLRAPRWSARELTHRLQHAQGREREALVAMLAAAEKWGLSPDTWAWPPDTSDARTVPARARAIKRQLKNADRARPIREDPILGDWTHGAPRALEPAQWEQWLRHAVRADLHGDAYTRRKKSRRRR
jgi:hypothetical protein